MSLSGESKEEQGVAADGRHGMGVVVREDGTCLIELCLLIWDLFELH
jgi:hypothetical protein